MGNNIFGPLLHSSFCTVSEWLISLFFFFRGCSWFSKVKTTQGFWAAACELFSLWSVEFTGFSCGTLDDIFTHERFALRLFKIGRHLNIMPDVSLASGQAAFHDPALKKNISCFEFGLPVVSYPVVSSPTRSFRTQTNKVCFPRDQLERKISYKHVL